MTTWRRRKREKRDLHFLNADGMVTCNPRDKEAAHRAEVDGITTDNPKAVTCKKCLAPISAINSSFEYSSDPKP